MSPELPAGNAAFRGCLLVDIKMYAVTSGASGSMPSSWSRCACCQAVAKIQYACIKPYFRNAPGQVRARLLADREEREAARLAAAALEALLQRAGRRLRQFNALDEAVAKETAAQEVRRCLPSSVALSHNSCMLQWEGACAWHGMCSFCRTPMGSMTSVAA